MGSKTELVYEDIMKSFPGDTTILKYGASLKEATSKLVTSPKTNGTNLDPTYTEMFENSLTRLGMYLSVYVSACVIKQPEAMTVIKNFSLVEWMELSDRYSEKKEAENQ